MGRVFPFRPPAFAVARRSCRRRGRGEYLFLPPALLIDPLLADFTKQTGIKTNVIFAEEGLIERMDAEGRNSPADVLLTVDIGRLMQAKDADVTQPISPSR